MLDNRLTTRLLETGQARRRSGSAAHSEQSSPGANVESLLSGGERPTD
jgi:hypothetical protein